MSEARTSPATLAEPSPREPLLRTKLYRRAPPPSIVPRPRLVEHLGQGLSCRLVLISAPAGFGKTTILSEWLASCPCSVAWVSLDSGDDDPATFLRYVVAALQSVAPEVGRSVSALIRSPQLPPLESILTVLLNDLYALPGDLALVLEDYHSISSPAVHSGVTYLLDHLPPTAHLIVATRADPPLPLARLRSRGELVEVRADDLRFGPDEARALLERTAGIHLTDAENSALQARTEGWAVGLQLAALSLRGRRGRDDVSQFVEDFAGSHRYVADYLLEEVLSHQPEAVQSFLLQTSILDRLSGPLVDAVTGESDGQAMLERLETENLFLVPLDDERRWYRYHHLFADLLRSRLLRSDVASAHGLHRRAARWLDQEGFASEAVSHSLAAVDYELAALLVVKHWLPVAANGQTTRVYRWLSSLPDAAVRGHPWLAFAAAWLCYLQGHFDKVGPYVDDMSRALAESKPGDAPVGSSIPRAGLLDGIPALRSYLATQQGDAARALALAQEAVAVTATGRVLSQGHALGALAVALEQKPDSAGAVDGLERAVPKFREAGNSLAVAFHAHPLARLLIRRGQLARAEATCREVLRRAEEDGLVTLPAFAIIHTALADVFLERGELDAAEEELERGEELGRDGGSFEDVKARQITLARLQMARGDFGSSLDTLRAAADLVSRSGSALAVAEVAAWRATAALRSGDLEAASRWLEHAATRGGSDRGYLRELESLAIARILVASRQEAEAVELLDRLLGEAEADGRAGSQIAALALRALARRGQGKVDQGLADLHRALALARPEGYARAFLGEGAGLADLLRRGVAERQWPPPVAEYAGKLLGKLEPPERRSSTETATPRPQTPPTPSRTPPPLIEPLSDREREVLGLMAEGLTNEQIASRLIIALGTVKAHIHNISSKLGAQNRAHAVARAREQGLL